MKPFWMPLTEPLGAIWLLMVIGVAVMLLKKHRKCAALAAVPVLLIFLLGSTPIPEWLVGAAEKKQAAVAARFRNDLVSKPYDCVVVLGGGHTVSKADPLGFTVSEAGDRILAGLELARKCHARALVLGGSGEGKGNPGVPEALAVQRWILQMNDIPNVVTNLGLCRNTRDEALAAKALLQERGWKDVVLVTSALHMKRSLAVFEKAGVRAVPMPCDYQVHRVSRDNKFSIFPRQWRFTILALWLHERIGWGVYNAKGWV